MDNITASIAAFFAAHAVLALCVGAWIAVATFLNRTLWPKTPEMVGWVRIVHLVVIDWPALLAAPGYRGYLKALGIPFLSISFGSGDGEEEAPRRSSKGGFVLMGALIFLGVLGAMIVTLLSGCGPAGKEYGLRYAACMKAKGQAVLAGVEQKVADILTNGTTNEQVQADLEQLAGGGVVDAVICAVQAWLGDHPLPTSGAAPHRLVVARAGGEAFLAAHGVR